MGRKPSSDRPLPVGLPGLRARAVRGPKDGLWYWRAEYQDKTVAWTGWATREQMGARVAELMVTKRAAPSAPKTWQLETVDDLNRAWIAYLEDHRPDLAEGSMRAYRLRVRQLRSAGCSGYDLERMGAATMEAAKAALLRLYAPRTAYTCLQLIGAAWTWGRREGLVPDRELLVPVVRIEKKPKRTPSTEEISRVVLELHGYKRLAARFLWGTGARIGELAHLTWDQVDLVNGDVLLNGKTGGRRVPLGTELLANLRAWHQANDEPVEGYVTTMKPNTVMLLNKHLKKACKRAKVPPFTCHALRRAAVDALARSGVDVSTAAELLGHTPQVMLEYYRQVTQADLRLAVRRANLGQLPSGEVYEFSTGRPAE